MVLGKPDTLLLLLSRIGAGDADGAEHDGEDGGDDGKDGNAGGDSHDIDEGDWASSLVTLSGLSSLTGDWIPPVKEVRSPMWPELSEGDMTMASLFASILVAWALNSCILLC